MISVKSWFRVFVVAAILFAVFVTGVTADEPPKKMPEPAQAVEKGELPTHQAPEGPRVHVKTSGAVGVPTSFKLPEKLKHVGTTAAQSPNDWSADFTEDFESGIGANWLIFDQSDDGYERSWGADDYQANGGSQSVWVAAAGADALDPEQWYYPHNLDSWLVTNRYFDLSDKQMADVEFYMWMDTEPGWDWVFIGASVDGQNFSGEYWTGNSGGWQYFDLNLSEFIGYPQVYLAWYFHSDGSNLDRNYEGVWLDDIAVWTYVDTGPVEGNERIQNGDFETGDLSGWTVPSGSTVVVTQKENPVSGDYVAWFGGIPNASEAFYQAIAIPDEALADAQLGFWLNLFGAETEVGVDSFCVGMYSDSSLTPPALVDIGCLDGVDAVASAFDPEQWWQVDYHLTGEQWNAVKGRTVYVAFEMYTNDSINTSVFVDDVTFEVVTGGSAGDEYEPNDGTDAATAATLGTPMSGLTIDPDNDLDFFSFSGNAGDTVVVDIDAAVNGSALDSIVGLLDSSGEVFLAVNDDDGNSFDAYLSYELADDGTYYVVVGSYDGSGDRSYVYDLLISVTSGGAPTPTPPPTPPSAQTPTPTPGDTPTPPPGETPTPPPSGARMWTAILYMDGDNNLCDSYPGLITRMENELGAKIGSSGFLNVAVLIDRDPNYCSSGSATRYFIQSNGNYQDNVNRWDMGEINMGDPQTLINFATWAMQNYPAEHYYLAIDNHGGGISGIAWDDTNSHDNITNDELYRALKEITQNGSRKLDVFAYEACLMGMYEDAYDIRQFTDYIFFFPTISWSNNASYPSYLGHPNFTAAATGQQLGEIIFDVYYAAVTNPYAVSLVDASKMGDVQAAVSAWADALSAQVGTFKDNMTTARSNAQKIDVTNDNLLNDDDSYIDLWDLADKMAAQGLATTEATGVKDAVDAAVVRANYRSYSTLDYANTHGLSIYWPQTMGGWYTEYVSDQVYNSTRDGTWDEFLQAYFSGGGDRASMPSRSGPVERPAATGGYKVFLPVILKQYQH